MITRYERIKTLPFNEMVNLLCSLTGECANCQANKYCSYSHKGYIDWLTKEVDEAIDYVGICEDY